MKTGAIMNLESRTNKNAKTKTWGGIVTKVRNAQKLIRVLR